MTTVIGRDYKHPSVAHAVSLPGFRNWLPKIGSCKISGRSDFEGGSQYTQISTINMYKFIKIRHDIMRQCHGNYKEMTKFIYKGKGKRYSVYSLVSTEVLTRP